MRRTRGFLALALAGAAAFTMFTGGCVSGDHSGTDFEQVRVDNDFDDGVSSRHTGPRKASSQRARAADSGKSKAAPKPKATPSEKRPAPRSGNWPTMSSNGSSSWTALAYPTGNARTSALGVEKGMPREVRLNQPFDYEIIVTNLTGEELSDVVVSDDPGNGLSVNSSFPQARMASGAANWNIGKLGPHESKTIRVNGTATTEGSVGSCASASYSSVLCNEVAVVSPKLRLVKTGPSDILKCDPFEYKFEVSNTGTGTIRGVKINDPLPKGLRTVDGKQNITFNVGDLAAGQTKRYSARVNADKTGSYQNKATVSSADDISASSGQVNTTVRAPKLTLTQSCPKREFIGRPLNYTFTVANTGDGVCKNATLTASMPSGATFTSASDGGRASDSDTVTWNLGELKPRQSKDVTLRISTRTAGTVNMSSSLSCACAETVRDSCSTEVTGIPAILLEVVDLEDPAPVGSQTTYVVTVTNQGSAPGTNIKIICELEANQTFVSGSGATNATSRGRTITFAPIASLGPKQRAQFRIVVDNASAGDVRFTTTMTSDQLTREVKETEATHVYE